eukprot:scaffold12472_cov115-Cylindrotheca_fusiformis.AAC.7
MSGAAKMRRATHLQAINCTTTVHRRTLVRYIHTSNQFMSVPVSPILYKENGDTSNDAMQL